MLTLVLVVLSAADDVSGVWVAKDRTVVVGRDGDKLRAVLNRSLVYELEKTGDVYAPTPEAEAAAGQVVGKKATLPKLYPLDGKRLGVGSRESLYTRTPNTLLDLGLRALQDKLSFPSIQSEKNRATVWSGMLMSANVEKRCVLGVLMPPARETPSVAAKRDAKVRATELSWLEGDGADCDAPLPAAFKVQGNAGGVYLLSDPSGKPLGLQVVGYMYAEAFMREGTTAAQAREIFENAKEELGKAAE